MGYTMGLGTASGRKWAVVEARRMKCLWQREVLQASSGVSSIDHSHEGSTTHMLGGSCTAWFISDGCSHADILIRSLQGQLRLDQVTSCPWLSLLVTEGVRV